MFSDPMGRDFFGDLWKFVGTVVLYVVAIIATAADLTLGYIRTALSLQKAPTLHIESDGWTVENSAFGDLFGSASWGPAIFLSAENEYLGDIWKHEYGHRLQFQEWGGWEYMGFMINRTSFPLRLAGLQMKWMRIKGLRIILVQ